MEMLVLSEQLDSGSRPGCGTCPGLSLGTSTAAFVNLSLACSQGFGSSGNGSSALSLSLPALLWVIALPGRIPLQLRLDAVLLIR